MYSQSMVMTSPGLSDKAGLAVNRAGKILAFTLFAAVGAQFAVRLPFTPVPVTMQTLFVVMAGVVLGPRDGFYAMLSYLALGISGAPVFAGLTFGPAVLFGPTGGYLMAFPAAAFLAGYLPEIAGGNTAARALGIISGLALILLSGAAYLCLITGLSIADALMLAVIPFIIAEIAKFLAAVFIAGRI
ncbi:MAG: biotin transporter BioY [Candidatus Krumholzibacteriota bacterium]|nr:biotin transporter BioY [Candidatus Krumholzibacteriota bacterium]